MRETDTSRALERKLAGFLVALVIVALIGPMGTYSSMGFWDRLSYWTVMLLVVGAIAEAVLHVAMVSPRLARLPPWGRILIAALITSIPATPMVTFIHRVFRGHGLPDEAMPALYLGVAGVTFVIGATDHYLWRNLLAARAGQSAPASPVERDRDEQTADTAGDPASTVGAGTPPMPPAKAVLPPLARHLPDRLRTADIICLNMQDHYVEVVTSAGSHLVLMRLGDAIALLDGLPGLRTHRSHWAALTHAEELERDGRRHLLRLSDGRRLPVSTTYLGAVRAALQARKS